MDVVSILLGLSWRVVKLVVTCFLGTRISKYSKGNLCLKDYRYAKNVLRHNRQLKNISEITYRNRDMALCKEYNIPYEGPAIAEFNQIVPYCYEVWREHYQIERNFTKEKYVYLKNMRKLDIKYANVLYLVKPNE